MKGFTLIELCVALSILAILASVLLPRVAELQRAARVGDLRYLHGAVSTRMMLIHLAVQARQGVADAKPCAGGGGTANNQPTGTVCTERGLVPTLHGYPAATPQQTFGLLPAEMPADRYRVRTENGKAVFMRSDATHPEACSFTYSQALDATTAAAISVPVSSGC